MAACDAMARFGILQVRDPARGRNLPSHIPDGVRALSLESRAERELASQIIAHLRRVAGWVTRYHAFKPEVGMGIAAPQLGIAYRIAILRKSHSERFLELVNPRVVAATPEHSDEYEGCLSFFDVRGIVRRPVSVTVAYERLDGGPATTVFTGALARNVQHEIDHLNGKLYTDEDRMPAGMSPIPVDEYRAMLTGGRGTPVPLA
jgi:peptide deformylase